MAEFCRKCCEEIMGLDPDKHTDWVVKDNWICEGCGYNYLEVK